MHEKYMTLALQQAKKALYHNEVPIGAIVVDEKGVVIGRGYNKMEKNKCQTGHAEIIAIEKACKKIGDWRLTGCWLYVTLEPCNMCLGLIKLSRISGVVFGAKQKNLTIFEKDLALCEGIKEDECVELLQKFFKNARQKE